MSQRTLLPFFLALLTLLAGCARDEDLVQDFLNTWMEERGMMEKDPETGEYKPTLGALGVATGWSSSGDDRIDAAVQAGKMVKDIKDTDKLVDEAVALLEERPPMKNQAMGKLNVAVSRRPDDWYYRNHRGALHAQGGDYTRAGADFKHAEAACQGNSHCLRAHYDMLLRVLEDPKTGPSRDPGSHRYPCGRNRIMADTYEQLASLSQGSSAEHYRRRHYNMRQLTQTGACVP